MKTMRRIEQPLQFEQPSALENSLLEIQQHYQQIVQHIDYFDSQTFQPNHPNLDRARRRIYFDNINGWHYIVDFEDSSSTESSDSESE